MAHCAVIGLGKLGSCLAAVLASAGHDVRGVDTNVELVRDLNDGFAPVPEPGLQELIAETRFKCFSEYAPALKGADIAFIVLPTPSLEDGRFDDTLVREAVAKVNDEIYNDGPTVVVVCSTVMPGTCAGIAETLAAELHLVYSPEFIALGSVIADMRNPDLILIGHDADEDGYGPFVAQTVLESIIDSHCEVHLMPWTDAEIAKLAINAYITMKISYANELTDICDGYEGVSARVVCSAVGADTRIGHKYLKPGTAFGGPCFPRDGRAFAAAADAVDSNARLARATDAVNMDVLQRAFEWAEGQDAGTVAILGLTYKPKTYVTEESAGVRLAEMFFASGISVYGYDPTFKGQGNLAILDNMDDANLCDVVLVLTPWREFAGFDARRPTYDPWAIVMENEHVYRPGES